MDILNHAKRYIKNGWSVFPIPKGQKNPTIKWGEFRERYATDKELALWFTSNDSNIGIATGKLSNLSVLDADGKTGNDILAKQGLSSVGTVITGSGGRQLFFKFSGQTNKWTSKDHEGLDSRGEGGYVVAPPSFHPNGGTYKWANGIPHSSALPNWPKGLLESPLSQGNTSVTLTKSTEPWIVDALKGVGSGERHRTLVRLACYFLPRHHYDIVKHYLIEWNQKNTPPMSEDEVVKQLNDINNRFKKGQYKTNYFQPKEEVRQPSKLDIAEASACESYFMGQMLHAPLTIPELPTGYKSLDKATYGLKRGNLYTIGARPGTGKTTFACNITSNLCKIGKRVLYFSTEMSRDELFNKFAASDGDIAAQCFEDHNFDEQSKGKLVQFIQRFKAYDLHVVRLFSPDRKSVEQAILDIKPDVVIFDHIQHTATGEHEYGEISKFIRFLKELAMQANIAVVVASQLHRGAALDGVVPEIYHLKSCGTIEEESSVVLLLHDETKKDDRTILFKVAKNRYGKTGNTLLLFKANVTRFEDTGMDIQ